MDIVPPEWVQRAVGFAELANWPEREAVAAVIKERWQGVEFDDKRATLWWAAKNGHLDVLQWLELTAADARLCNNYAFRWAAYKGHLTVLQWLTDQFEN